MKVIVVRGSGEEQEFRLHDGINSVGRGLGNRIRLLDPRVSRKHCKIRKVGCSLFLMDLGTRNGTQVNGKTVVEQELKLYDEIRIGKTVLKVVEEDYVLERVPLNGPRSLFKKIRSAFSGRRERRAESPEDDFSKYAPRRRKRLWRPKADTDPPEGRSETVISTTDPDS